MCLASAVLLIYDIVWNSARQAAKGLIRSACCLVAGQNNKHRWNGRCVFWASRVLQSAIIIYIYIQKLICLSRCQCLGLRKGKTRFGPSHLRASLAGSTVTLRGHAHQSKRFVFVYSSAASASSYIALKTFIMYSCVENVLINNNDYGISKEHQAFEKENKMLDDEEEDLLRPGAL
jgi:hypothetical protein